MTSFSPLICSLFGHTPRGVMLMQGKSYVSQCKRCNKFLRLNALDGNWYAADKLEHVN